MKRNESELQVIVKTKNLCTAIMNATSRSPKKFRFTLVARLQNYSLSALESLYRSNEIFTKNSSQEELKERLSWQYKALSEFNILTFFIQVSYEQNCILKKEYLSLSNQIFECKKMLSAWIKSERSRLSKITH